MIKRYLTSTALVIALLFAVTTSAEAQDLRPDRTFFVKPQVGISHYLGDNKQTLFSGDEFDIDGKFPYALGIGIGYQFSVPFSLNLDYRFADYPVITQFGSETSGAIEDDPTTRNSIMLTGQYNFANADSRIAPYLKLGANVTWGETATFPDRTTTSDEVGFGPTIGAGLDIALNRRTSLFFDLTTNMVFPNDAADGTEEKTGFDDTFGFDASADFLTALGFGLKVNFKSAFTAVEVLATDGPTRLNVNEQGTFTATTNDEEATRPVSYTWDFGDGTTTSGLLVNHSYAEEGEYTVTFTASNERSTDTATRQVTVLAPAEIITISADPMDPDTDTSVQFSSNVTGSTPIDYAWDFGDGNTGTGESPSHTFNTAGDYTVTLTASNEAGDDTATLDITVATAEADYCAEVVEMNSAFFDQNSSVLTDEGQSRLMENVQIFQDCPNTSGRIEGFVGPFERNPQELSEDRARAVEQFYLDQGLSADRFTVQGMGRTGEGAKKAGAEEFRRVDTIPVRN